MSSHEESWYQYQVKALTWHDQLIDELKSKNSRLRQMVWASMLMSLLLLISLLVSIFHQHVEMLIMHHRANGSAWITRANHVSGVVSKAEQEGNLVRYVRARESYSPSSYAYQFNYVKHASTESVYRSYEKKSAYRNKFSLVREDGKSFYRTVTVHSVMFMPKLYGRKGHLPKQDPMADISYQVCRHAVHVASEVCVEKHALIGWHYSGIPSDPKSRWINWRGFTVSYFETVRLGLNKSNKHLNQSKKVDEAS